MKKTLVFMITILLIGGALPVTASYGAPEEYEEEAYEFAQNLGFFISLNFHVGVVQEINNIRTLSCLDQRHIQRSIMRANRDVLKATDKFNNAKTKFENSLHYYAEYLSTDENKDLRKAWQKLNQAQKKYDKGFKIMDKTVRKNYWPHSSSWGNGKSCSEIVY